MLFTVFSLNVLTICLYFYLQKTVYLKKIYIYFELSEKQLLGQTPLETKAPLMHTAIVFQTIFPFPPPPTPPFFSLFSLACSLIWVPLATSFTNGKIAVLSVVSLFESEMKFTWQNIQVFHPTIPSIIMNTKYCALERSTDY